MACGFGDRVFHLVVCSFVIQGWRVCVLIHNDTKLIKVVCVCQCCVCVTESYVTVLCEKCGLCTNGVRDSVVCDSVVSYARMLSVTLWCFSCVCVCLCCSLCDNVARCLPHNKYFIASFSGRTCSACHIICRGATATRATHNHGKVAHRLPHKWCLSRMSSRKQLASHQTKPVHPSKPRVINATPAVTMLCVCMGVYV